MNRLRKYYCWFPKTSSNAVATWGAQRGRETTLKLIKQNLGVSKRQSSSLKTQAVNEHRWLRLSHPTVTCRDHPSAGRAGKALLADKIMLLAHFFLSCFSQTWDKPSFTSLQKADGSTSFLPAELLSGFCPLSPSDPFAPRAGQPPGSSHWNSSVTLHKPMNPTFSSLSSDTSRKHSLCSPICSGRALQVTTWFWSHRLAPARAVVQRWSSPCTLCQPRGVKAAEAVQEGALLTAPWWALSKKRPPRFIEEGWETHLQALLSFHLQEKRDLQ